MRKICLRVRCFAVLISTSLLTNAADVISTWDGSTGNWSDVSHWDSTDFPNNGNGGFTFDANINSGSLAVDQAINIDALAFSGGTIGGSDALMLTPLDWTGGTFNSTGLVTVGGGTLGADVFSSLRLDGTTLRLTGDVEWVGDSIIQGSSLGTHKLLDIVPGQCTRPDPLRLSCLLRGAGRSHSV
ncbi:MAG: hypothetical protein ABGX16_25085 [Pirellulales bacterium]